jgi:GrpB-like predicted nucleotidyltransferase (UPF0157 family)
MSDVSIVAARTEWSREFDTLADELRDVAAASIVGIFHVGSTSVPGLAAKDVIDVQVSVGDDGSIDRTLGALANGGFHVRDDIRRDHVVPGEPEDEASWRKGFANERPGERRANIHVRVAGRANHRYALLFRDYLRAQPETAAIYAAFKVKAAALLSRDSNTYADLKDPVCDLSPCATVGRRDELARTHLGSSTVLGATSRRCRTGFPVRT